MPRYNNASAFFKSLLNHSKQLVTEGKIDAAQPRRLIEALNSHTAMSFMLDDKNFDLAKIEIDIALQNNEITQHDYELVMYHFNYMKGDFNIEETIFNFS